LLFPFFLCFLRTASRVFFFLNFPISFLQDSLQPCLHQSKFVANHGWNSPPYLWFLV
jgi:hypothetical protein